MKPWLVTICLLMCAVELCSAASHASLCSGLLLLLLLPVFADMPWDRLMNCVRACIAWQ